MRPLGPVEFDESQFGPLQELVREVREEAGDPARPSFIVTGHERRLDGMRANMSSMDHPPNTWT